MEVEEEKGSIAQTQEDKELLGDSYVMIEVLNFLSIKE
jgi:hypothetical protein